MKKKSLIMTLVTILALALSCSIFFLTACNKDNKKGKEYTVTFVAEHAKVTVEGYTELPVAVEEGASLTFKVEPDNGYEVTNVEAKVGDTATKLRASNGNYKINSVSGDTTVTVTTALQISSVAVTTNPDKLEYNAGEELDKTGMVVTVTYSDNSTEPITNYSVNYSEGASTFLAGDTSFTVSASGKVSAPVNLTNTVKGYITLDPDGGTLDVDGLFDDREDVTVTEAGGKTVIEYTALTAAIELPDKTHISKLTAENKPFEFAGWNSITGEGENETSTAMSAIPATTRDSLNLRASWKATIIKAQKMELELLDQTAATAAGLSKAGPYLVITAEFYAADSANIYMFEGNDNVEFVGDEYQSNGSGQPQKIYFDLTQLGSYKNGAYAGKWMDLKFQATIGSQEYEQEFILDHEAEELLAQVGCSVCDGINSYTILTHHSQNVDRIKVAFKPFGVTYSFGMEGNNFTVSGNVNTASITGYEASKTYTVSLKVAGVDGSAQLGANGSFKLAFDVTQMQTANATVFSNLTVSEGESQVASYEFSYTGALDGFDYSGSKFGDPSWYANKLVAENGFVVYVGNMGSDWQKPFYSVVDEPHAIDFTGVRLEAAEETGAPLLVYTGTYGTAFDTEDKVIEAVLAKFDLTNQDQFSLQCYSGGSGQWTYVWRAEAHVDATEADPENGTEAVEEVAGNISIRILEGNKFELVCDITKTQGGADVTYHNDDILYGHFQGSNMSLTFDATAEAIEYNGLSFKLDAANSACANWMSALTILYVTPAEAAE